MSEKLASSKLDCCYIMAEKLPRNLEIIDALNIRGFKTVTCRLVT